MCARSLKGSLPAPRSIARLPRHSCHERDFNIPASRVFLCAGGHAGIAIALASASLEGAAIAVDELTYPHFRAMAAERRIQLIACAGDDDGILPDALAAAARVHGVKAVYLMPTVHNPLGTVMSHRQTSSLLQISFGNTL